MTVKTDFFDFPAYAAIVAAIESGSYKYGDGYCCKNATSTAYGRYQLINAVFIDTLGVVDHAPLAQERAFYKFTMDNLQSLRNESISPSVVTLYTLHNQGRGGGITLLKARSFSSSQYFVDITKRITAAKIALGGL